MVRPLPDSLDGLACAQQGLLTRPQILAVPGVTQYDLDDWLEAGVLLGEHRGVYRLAGAPRTKQQIAMGAVLRSGRGAVLADEWVLGLVGLEGFGMRGAPRVAITRERRVTGVAFDVVRTCLDASHVTVVDGIPAMTPLRAFVGASARHRARQMRVGYDDGRRKGLLDEASLRALAVELGQVPGAAETRRLLGTGFAAHDSEGERSVPSLFRPGDPVLTPQVWVEACGRWYRLDFGLLIARMGLEYHGEAHHSIDVDLEADAQRDLDLRTRDVELVHLRKAHLRTPERTRRRILAIAEARIRSGVQPLVPELPPWLR